MIAAMRCRDWRALAIAVRLRGHLECIAQSPRRPERHVARHVDAVADVSQIRIRSRLELGADRRNGVPLLCAEQQRE